MAHREVEVGLRQSHAVHRARGAQVEAGAALGARREPSGGPRQVGSRAAQLASGDVQVGEHGHGVEGLGDRRGVARLDRREAGVRLVEVASPDERVAQHEAGRAVRSTLPHRLCQRHELARLGDHVDAGRSHDPPAGAPARSSAPRAAPWPPTRLQRAARSGRVPSRPPGRLPRAGRAGGGPWPARGRARPGASARGRPCGHRPPRAPPRHRRSSRPRAGPAPGRGPPPPSHSSGAISSAASMIDRACGRSPTR